MVDGHPRESLEASFDIVHGDFSKANEIGAEVVTVVSEVLSLLPSEPRTALPYGVLSPMWYIRLNHTKLADAILDLCGILKDTTRRACLQILSQFTAPSPHWLQRMRSSTKGKHRSSEWKKDAMAALDGMIETAESTSALSKASGRYLRDFVLQCMPLSCVYEEAVEALKGALARLRDTVPGSDHRRSKRFEDAVRSLGSLCDFVDSMSRVVQPLIDPEKEPLYRLSQRRPIYISLDLGLRQKRKHYHGGVIFQCVALPDTYFDELDPTETNESLIAPSGRGMKLAEGGEYTDLVRKFRPPGNFASSVVNQYTAASIPFCMGVRFPVGKFVELAYLDATLQATERWATQDSQKSASDAQTIDILRLSLGHPFSYSTCVQCLVASVHGLDSATVSDRLMVASILWSEGISAEYLPHSGIMLSLLKRTRDEDEGQGASDWSLVELMGVCAILNIPYAVIVQPHVLREKRTVRLRRIVSEGLSGNHTGMEVTLENLAGAIRGDKGVLWQAPPEEAMTRERTAPCEIECVLVDGDVYYGYDHEVSKNETSQWRSYLKAMKKAELASESFVKTLSGDAAVFAVTDVSFWALRDFGTALMRHSDAMAALPEVSESYPKFKRALKTLAVAVDHYMRRRAAATLLLYSRTDDQFDVVSLKSKAQHTPGRKHRK